MKKQIKQSMYRLFIRIVDKTKPVEMDNMGRRWSQTKWIEVKEANLGSIKIPNKEIIEFRFEPIKIEEDDRDNPKKINLDDFLRRFLGQ